MIPIDWQSRAEKAERELVVALKLQVFCENCGGTYAQTGIEVGCPCVELKQLREFVTKVREIDSSFRFTDLRFRDRVRDALRELYRKEG